MTKDEVCGDVAFRNPAEGDYRLKPASCCRDAGVKMSDAFERGTDLDGNPRVCSKGRHPAVDLGCYETRPSKIAVMLR